MTLPKLSDIKNWSPEIEKSITSEWRKSEKFKFNPKTKKPIYSIDTPPPYVNSPIHIGQAITYCYMDFFARYRRMKGQEVLFPLGLDRNGLPIEVAAEKKFNISPFKAGREEFLKACENLLQESSAESIESFSRLGISFSSYKQGKNIGDIYETDSSEYRALTQATFINLFKKDLIYEDIRINNWDTKLQTTIADSEIEYKDIPTSFNHVKFKVKETGENITIATTRPELICTCAMVIFNPEDERYQKLEGLTAITPMFEKQVPIKAHPLAQKEKGSGLVMMCSAGDVTDIQFFREQGLKPIIAINKNGTMNSHAKFLEGLSVKKAREVMINELKENDLLIKQEHITHSTPISERSGAELEFIEMPEFYLKQIEFKDNIKEIANKITFYPSESKEMLEKWVDSIAIDWPISRRRFYANPIPLWHSSDGSVAVPSPGKYYQPWREQAPQDAEVFKKGKFTGKRVNQLPNLSWKGDERVLDTWFDSSISELYLLQYEKNPGFFKKAYPASLRPQGKEIVRTWLYYTLLRGYLETEKPAFKDVWIHQHVLDSKGRKMSKSLGNVINPQDIINNEGTESLRFWSAIEGDISRGDMICSRERIKAESKTITKLLNVARFVLQFKKPKKATLTETDKAFLSYVEELTDYANEQYSKYDFHTPSLKLRQFLWEEFASHYLELVKARAYNAENKFSRTEAESARYALHIILERLIVLLYPIIPQVTSVIANALKIKFATFPKAKKVKDIKKPLSSPHLKRCGLCGAFGCSRTPHSKECGFNVRDITDVQKIMDFNSEVWKTKREKNISLRESIENIRIPKALKAYEQDLKACHNLQ